MRSRSTPARARGVVSRRALRTVAPACLGVVGGLLGPAARAAAQPATTLPALPRAPRPAAMPSLALAFERVGWSDRAPFEGSDLFGGLRLTVPLGDALELGLGALRSRGVAIRLPGRTEPLPRTLRYEGDLTYYLLGGGVRPYLMVGAGVLNTRSDSTRFAGDAVSVQYGAGLRVRALGQGGLDLYVRRYGLAYRRSADGLPTSLSALAQNTVVGGAFTVGFGPNRPSPTRWSGLLFEPFAARIGFDEATGFATTNALGGTVGVRLGTSGSVHATYWEGRSGTYAARGPLRGYGVEGRWHLLPTQFLSPYLALGAGRVNVRDSALAATGVTGRYQVNAGLGVQAKVLSWLQLSASARDVMMNERLRPGVAPRLTHGPMYTAGVTLLLGGRTDTLGVRRRAQAPAGAMLTIPRPESGEVRVTYGGVARDGVGATSVVVAGAPSAGGASGVGGALVPALTGAVVGATAGGAPAVAAPPVAALADTLPRSTRDSLRQEVDSATRAALAVRWARPLVRGELAAIDPRRREDGAIARSALALDDSAALVLRAQLARRLGDVLDDRLRVEHAAMKAAVLAELRREQVGARAEQLAASALDSLLAERLARSVSATTLARQRFDSLEALPAAAKRPVGRRLGAYGGVGFGDGTSILLGARADVGRPFFWRDPHAALVGEVAMGIGGGSSTSLLAQVHLQYRLGALARRGARVLRPYGTLGVGVLAGGGDDGIQGTITPGVGVAFLREGVMARGRREGWFAEYQGINLFADPRILAGYQWRW